MAKKTVTEVVEIEAGAVLNALRADGWPVGHTETVEALDKDGKPMDGFGGLRFTRETEAIIRQSPGEK